MFQQAFLLTKKKLGLFQGIVILVQHLTVMAYCTGRSGLMFDSYPVKFIKWNNPTYILLNSPLSFLG